MIPAGLGRGVAVLPYSPLARGMLAGNRDRQGGRRTIRAGSDPFPDQFYGSPADFDMVDRLAEVAEVAAARAAPPAQAAGIAFQAWLIAKHAGCPSALWPTTMTGIAPARRGRRWTGCSRPARRRCWTSRLEQAP